MPTSKPYSEKAKAPEYRARQPDDETAHRGFLRLKDVLRLIPVGKSTWWNGVKSGRYPSAVKLGPNITAWRAEDIRRWIEAQRGGTNA